MGQRLVISFSNEKGEFANAYFHWSGYTAPSACTMNEIAEKYAANITAGDTKEEAVINALYAVGAGISLKSDEEDLAKISPKLKYIQCANRNDGLIALNEQDRMESMRWAEADIMATVEKDESLVINDSFICCGDDLNAVHENPKELDELCENLGLETFKDAKVLINARKQYKEDPSKAAALIKKCSKYIETREHADDILANTEDVVLVKGGKVVNTIHGALAEGSWDSMFALDNGIVYEPIA